MKSKWALFWEGFFETTKEKEEYVQEQINNEDEKKSKWALFWEGFKEGCAETAHEIDDEYEVVYNRDSKSFSSVAEPGQLHPITGSQDLWTVR